MLSFSQFLSEEPNILKRLVSQLKEKGKNDYRYGKQTKKESTHQQKNTTEQRIALHDCCASSRYSLGVSPLIRRNTLVKYCASR